MKHLRLEVGFKSEEKGGIAYMLGDTIPDIGGSLGEGVQLLKVAGDLGDGRGWWRTDSRRWQYNGERQYRILWLDIGVR